MKSHIQEACEDDDSSSDDSGSEAACHMLRLVTILGIVLPSAPALVSPVLLHVEHVRSGLQAIFSPPPRTECKAQSSDS